MWLRSQSRGVDFCPSHASGVDLMGRNKFKILKSKSQNNRLRAPRRWSILHALRVAHLTLGFYGGRGDVLHRNTPAHRALVPLIHLTPAESLMRREAHMLLLLATNTQNWKNFRTSEASRPGCGPHPLAQAREHRHDADDDGGKQCGGARMETDNNRYNTSTYFSCQTGHLKKPSGVPN